MRALPILNFPVKAFIVTRGDKQQSKPSLVLMTIIWGFIFHQY
jgi:hypothetical protein